MQSPLPIILLNNDDIDDLGYLVVIIARRHEDLC
jgi:hypothetical protein